MLARLFRMFQVLSLDVVGGALATGVLVVRMLQVKPQPVWWLVLALAVWVVYTTDHLIDGFALKQQATILRHRMHYRYRYLFMTGVLLASVASVLLVFFFMDRKILLWGLLLGTGAVLYLMVVLLFHQKGSYFHKEFFIALFYVTGISLAPVEWYGHMLSVFQWLTLTVLFLLAWAEGLLMAVYEQKEDAADNTASFSTYYGIRMTFKFSGWLVLLAFWVSFVLLWLHHGFQWGHFLLMCMAAVLSTLVFFPAFFVRNQRYRWLGEFTFWLPYTFFL